MRTFRRALLAIPLLWGAAFLPAGCVPTGLAAPLAAPPKVEIPGQSTCGVVPSPTRPLVVEWSALDRASLEARAKQGIVAVHYVGCHIEVLPECVAPPRFAYAYVSTTTKHDTVHIRNEDDLYSNLPLGAAKLEGTLKRAGELRVEMTIVGRYGAALEGLPRDELVGPDCARATHVITGLTVGEFDLSAAGRASVSAAAGLFAGPSAGGRSSSSQQQIAQDGDERACERATGSDPGPPAECAAPLRIELTPVAAFERECPEGFHVERGICAPAIVRQCDEGTHYVEGRGCVPDHAVPIASDCPVHFVLRDGWCMPPIASASLQGGLPLASGPASSMAARLRGPSPEALRAEDLYASGDFGAAEQSAQRGCDAGDGFGCGLAGVIVARGLAGPIEATRGEDLLRRGCSMGDPWSCSQLGQ